MSGWKSLTLSLKILSVVLFLWAGMSVATIFMMPDREIAFYGFLLSGTSAAIVVILLDFCAPFVFLYATWNKLNWGANFGMLYNGIFILNNMIALFMFKDIFGNGIYFPLIVSTIFFLVIYRERHYFL